MTHSGHSRAAELRAALDRVRARIDEACRAAGRDPAGVRLLAVTKTFPAADVGALLDLGLVAFGESRDQEASAKIAEVAELRPDSRPRWEMVGRLQRNKARSVAGWADVVHSVDSARLVTSLARADRPVTALVQVSLDPEPVRGGVPPPQARELADAVAGSGLRLGGVMGLAPPGADPEPAFATLAEVSALVRADHPEATEISAGMSADLGAAIRYGSTCVRVGTALLGVRDLALP